MNKKMNTVIFILAGTVVNLLLAIVFIGLLLFGVSRLAPSIGDQAASLVPFAFIGGILLAMVVYQKLTKWVITKFNLTDKLDPLFTSRHRKKPNRN